MTEFDLGLGRPNHVGVFVQDIEKSLAFLKLVGGSFETTGPIVDQNQRVELLLIKSPGGIDIELVSGEGVRELQKQHGQGMYHLCFETSDLNSSRLKLLSVGAIEISEAKPAILFGGRLVQFFFTPVGIIELLEKF